MSVRSIGMETEMRAGSSGAEQNTLQQKQRGSKKRNHNSASAQMQLYVPAVRVWHGTVWPGTWKQAQLRLTRPLLVEVGTDPA